MDRQWRPNTIPPPIQFHGNVNVNVCPTCLIPHFPFCPHPPPPPPSYYPSQPPFSSGPTNWDTRPPPPPPPYHHPNPIADGDRSFKRPRIDDFNLWEEDERRLKLIRDHGRVALPSPNPNNHHPQFYGATTTTQQGYSSSHVNAAYRDDSENSRLFRGQPPLPSSPPPPLPSEPPLNHFKPPSLFPLHSAPLPPPPSYSQLPEPHHPYFSHEEGSKQYLGDPQPFSLKQLPAEKPRLVDASHLFRHPHRTSRPDHFVIIFRGLPGSGKSYLAKMLRDLEVENGGDAPRIHSLDDYFMTEVEKVEDNDASKSSSSGRNKKPVTKKVMEYCYEPEMEEAYRLSMLKAFKKTVEEGVFTFIIGKQNPGDFKDLLTQLGAAYKAIELDEESDGGDIQLALAEWTGLKTVPNVFIGGKHIGGCDTVLEKHQVGQLIPLLNDAGAIANNSAQL